jgi:NADH-quinone oxidoreductase subunit J
MGAMMLAHRERLTKKLTQRDHAEQRLRKYAELGVHPGPLPTPGVLARHNAVDTPALLPDGSVAPTSVSRVLQARGTVLPEGHERSDVEDVIKLEAGQDPFLEEEQKGSDA